jgi:hypothetical protein
MSFIWVIATTLSLFILVILTRANHIPGVATIPGEVGVDKNNQRLVLAADDLPSQGATLRVTTLTFFVRASAVNEAAANALALIEKNGSTGRIVLLINDQNIDSNELALKRAQSELAIKSQANAQLNFQTRLDGFKVRDKLRFIDDLAELDFRLQLQTINRTLEYTEPATNRDNWLYDISAALYTSEITKLIALAVRLSTNPQQPLKVRIQGID